MNTVDKVKIDSEKLKRCIRNEGYSIREFCEYAGPGISRQMLHRYLKKGELPLHSVNDICIALGVGKWNFCVENDT